MAIESITSALGTGSGIDIGALVNSLVEAQYANKNAQFEARSETLTAQISAVSRLKSGISGFSDALATLARSGSLSTQPTSSNSAIVTVSALSGATIPEMATAIEVRQLATGQVAHSGLIADREAPIGQGTLTLTFGEAVVENGAMTGFTAGAATPIDITIDASNSSLDGIAEAINARNAGVTASVLSDSNGARLVLKGATGASQAFTLSVTEDAAAPGLSALAIGPGATGTMVGTAARDAIVAVDGIEVRRASNSINNLIDGVRLDLQSAAVGTQVQIGSALPTENLRVAVQDFVATYNDMMAMLREDTNPVSGALARDPAAQEMKRALGQLTLTPLLAGVQGAPQTLAEIGVSTNRDGTLSVNAGRLMTVLAEHPQAVEAMFESGGAASGDGLPGALSSIADRMTSRDTGLGVSEQKYQRQQESLSEAQEKATDAAEAMRTRMTQQFASMDAKVAVYKSTQTFLEQQIDAWNAQD